MPGHSKKLRKLIQSQDIFGHHIHLNFNREGSSHRTIIGGLVSIFLKGFMCFYIYYNFKKMFLYEDDKQYVDHILLDLNDLGTVNYNETNQFIFFTMMKQLESYRGVYLNDTDLNKYITVGFT